MQSFPTSYTPQSGYPTHGPYGPGGEQTEQPSSNNTQSPPPQETQIQPPQQPQPTYIPQVMPQPQQPTVYSYYPQQRQTMGQYPPVPEQPQYPRRPVYQPQYPPQPDYYSDSDSKEDNEDDECHEVIGITLGGKHCPPQQDPVICCDCRVHSKPTTKQKKFKRSKPEEKPKDGESLCAHAFYIVERAKVKPVGAPWATDLYNNQTDSEEPTKIKVIRNKCKCCCKKKVKVESDSDEEEDTHSAKSSTSATNSKKHIMAFMKVFCSLLDKDKNKSGKKGNNGSAKSSLSFCCD